LPATIVARKIAINQTICKELLAMLPVVEQMLGQETCSNHPNSIMHPTCLL
jgi:hypothetical protein